MVEAVAAVPALDERAAVATSATWDALLLKLIITLCDEEGKLTAKPADVANAVKAIDASQVPASGSGDGFVTPFSLQLAGGEDEPFPLNTPVAIVGTAMMSRLGDKGTLKQVLAEINDQSNALTVVVRVAAEADAAKQRAAVLAGIAKLSSGKSVTTYQPRIVIAPGFSEDDAMGKALETVAGKLRAVCYVDCAAGATLHAASLTVCVPNCCARACRSAILMASWFIVRIPPLPPDCAPASILRRAGGAANQTRTSTISSASSRLTNLFSVTRTAMPTC